MMRRLVVTSLLALGGLLASESSAIAQEIQLTGPLAGAPAVRNLRWHRKQRIEIAPHATFTLLDEYQHTILFGLRLNYNFTDWLAAGLWGGYGAVHVTTGLTDEVEKVNKQRWQPWDAGADRNSVTKTVIDRNASVASVGRDFPSQTGQINWVVAPQLTAVPFRGKLAIFQKIFVDTDIYFFAGPAFIGLTERKNFDPMDPNDPQRLQTGACPAPMTGNCILDQPKYQTASRVAVTGTFGLGLTFYMGQWAGLGVEYRALPFKWNTSGFDSRGGPPDDKGPDNKVDEKDRTFKFNSMVSVSVNFYLPAKIKVSP